MGFGVVVAKGIMELGVVVANGIMEFGVVVAKGIIGLGAVAKGIMGLGVVVAKGIMGLGAVATGIMGFGVVVAKGNIGLGAVAKGIIGLGAVATGGTAEAGPEVVVGIKVPNCFQTFVLVISIFPLLDDPYITYILLLLYTRSPIEYDVLLLSYVVGNLVIGYQRLIYVIPPPLKPPPLLT